MTRNPSSYGRRVGAYLIDFLITWVPPIVLAVFGIVFLFADNLSPLGVVAFIVALFYAPVMGIYNSIFRQGGRGQTIGKSKIGTMLVRESTGQPVGIGWAFLRVFLAWILGFVTGGIYTLVDYIFPAFDSKKQRVTDKMLQMLVVDVASQQQQQTGTLAPARDNRFN